MKFNISKSSLLRALQAVTKVILKKNSIAILDNVLFSKHGDVFTITGSSQENSLTMPVELFLDSESKFEPFCIGPDVLQSLVSSLPEQPVEFDINLDTLKADISYSTGRVSLPVFRADAFPKLDSMKDVLVQFDLPTDVFLPAVKAASQCVGKSELRPVMTAVALDVNAEGVVFVGSDGHVLYKYVYNHGVPFLTKGNGGIILIPSPVISALTAPFNGIDTVTIKHDANHVTITAGDICFSIRDIDGRYPNYNSVIPKSQPYHILLPVKPLIESLRRVMLTASSSSELVRLGKDGSDITLSSQDIDFNRASTEHFQLAEGDKACTLPDHYAVGLKSSNFLMLLQSISTDNVLLELADPSRPMLLKEDGNSALTELEMPMLLEEND